MKRVVQPELLDSLERHDPEALRSRRDLRLINLLMGNERWILRNVPPASQVVELGAGEGLLTRRLAANHLVTALDLQDKPEGLECQWIRGNLLKTLEDAPGETLVANLILHHFDESELVQLGKLFKERKRLLFVEPWRSPISVIEGYAIWPLIDRVTKHDMMVSIRAGFKKGELKALLSLGENWVWRESICLRGGLRIIAQKK